MKRFGFRLDPILRLRSHKEEEWRKKLGAANAVCEGVRRNIRLLNSEQQEVFNRNVGADIAYQQSRAVYLDRIERKLRELDLELEEAEAERMKVLEVYRKYRMEYEAIQRLKDKRQREYRKEWFREENREVDDIVNARNTGGVHGEL